MAEACCDGLNVLVTIAAVNALKAGQRWDTGLGDRALRRRTEEGSTSVFPPPAEVLNVVFADVVIEK